MNATLLYVIISNATAGLPLYNCTEHSITYEVRGGSLLATDLTLWLVSSLMNKTLCYKSKDLLPSNFPFQLASKIVKGLMKELPKIKNIEELRTLGEWYYTMLSSTPNSEELRNYLTCLEKYDDLRALYCFEALKGEYERFVGRVLAVGLNPCLPRDLSFGEAYAVAAIAKRLRGGNFTLVLNFLYSLYAYGLYYNSTLAKFAKEKMTQLVLGTCSPMEVLLSSLCLLGSSRWWECYSLLSFLLR